MVTGEGWPKPDDVGLFPEDCCLFLRASAWGPELGVLISLMASRRIFIKSSPLIRSVSSKVSDSSEEDELEEESSSSSSSEEDSSAVVTVGGFFFETLRFPPPLWIISFASAFCSEFFFPWTRAF